MAGFQSLSVRDNRFMSAFWGSVLIGAAQLFQWKLMPSATPVQMTVWLSAGPLAVISAMWAHPKIHRVDKKKTAHKSTS